MNVSLSVPLEKYIAKKVESGNYNSASEVIREGLRSLQEKEARQEQKMQLDALLIERLAKLEAGEKGTPLKEAGDKIIKGIKERMTT